MSIILVLCCVVQLLGDFKEISLFVEVFCKRLCQWILSIGIGICLYFHFLKFCIYLWLVLCKGLLLSV